MMKLAGDSRREPAAYPVSRMDAEAPRKTRERDYRLDFFRGLALILIFIDHVPGNFLSNFTLSSVAFFDAAEVFIFISGYTAALVYGTTFDSKGPVYGTARIYRRVWQLYVAHLFIFMVYTAAVSFIVQRFENPMYNDELHVGDFLTVPETAIVKALTLQFQPSFLDVLPVYIVFLAAFPLILVGLRRSVFLVLIPSLLLYAVVQIWDVNLPGYPEDRFWFFDPLAWQLPFVAGALFGNAHTGGGPLPVRNRALVRTAAAVIGVLGAVRLSWTLHEFWDDVPALGLRLLWPVDKTLLEPVRLVNFFAAALLLARWIQPTATWLRGRIAWPLILCGQNSLEIFCWGIFLALIGHFLTVEISDSLAMQLTVSAGGVAAMIALAYLMTWYKHGGTLPKRPSLERGIP